MFCCQKSLPRCLWPADRMPQGCLHHDVPSEVTRCGSVAALKMMLRSDGLAVRQHAICRLGQMGPAAAAALPALVELLVNEEGTIDTNVRRAMDEILGALRPATGVRRSCGQRFLDALVSALRLGTA
jgi:hypothetical protein